MTTEYTASSKYRKKGHLGGGLLVASKWTKKALVSGYESPFKSVFIKQENL